MYYTITFLILMMGQVGCVYASNFTPADSTIQQTIKLAVKYLTAFSHIAQLKNWNG